MGREEEERKMEKIKIPLERENRVFFERGEKDLGIGRL